MSSNRIKHSFFQKENKTYLESLARRKRKKKPRKKKKKHVKAFKSDANVERKKKEILAVELNRASENQNKNKRAADKR